MKAQKAKERVNPLLAGQVAESKARVYLVTSQAKESEANAALLAAQTAEVVARTSHGLS